MKTEALEFVQRLINNHKIIVFIKGSKTIPLCGFSDTIIRILTALKVQYETYDVLKNSEVRQAIKEYSSWPTIPQLYINTEFIGGADIVLDLYEKGQLQTIIEIALAN